MAKFSDMSMPEALDLFQRKMEDGKARSVNLSFGPAGALTLSAEFLPDETEATMEVDRLSREVSLLRRERRDLAMAAGRAFTLWCRERAGRGAATTLGVVADEWGYDE